MGLKEIKGQETENQIPINQRDTTVTIEMPEEQTQACAYCRPTRNDEESGGGKWEEPATLSIHQRIDGIC
jgi:hypothetical protein